MPRQGSSLWNHVTKQSHYGGSGSQKWKCKFCGEENTGSATRLHAHFSKTKGYGIEACSAVSKDVYDSLRSWKASQLGIPLDKVPDVEHSAIGMGDIPGEEDEEGTSSSVAFSRKKQKATKQNTEESGCHTSSKGKLPVFNKGDILSSFQKAQMKIATRELTQLFIQCGLSFNITRAPRWKKAMRAISRIGCAWEGPSYEALRTTELRREKNAVERAIEPLKTSWIKYGCTLLCDGWTDIRKRNVYNVLVSSCKGTMFLHAIDASKPGTVVTGEFIMSHLRTAINEIGAENIVQVITDNGSNCVSMGRMLEEEFPSIVWSPCASHSLDLMLEDIGKLSWVNGIFCTASSMVNFVTKRPKVLSMYRANSDLELLKPSQTRFAYMFIVLERLVRVRHGLLRTVVCREWQAWEDRNDSKSLGFARIVMRDAYWDEASGLIKALQPIYSVLRLTDMEGSTIGLLYEFMDKIGESLNICNSLSTER